jgi:hypothetical protein
MQVPSLLLLWHLLPLHEHRPRTRWGNALPSPFLLFLQGVVSAVPMGSNANDCTQTRLQGNVITTSFDHEGTRVLVHILYLAPFFASVFLVRFHLTTIRPSELHLTHRMRAMVVHF